VGHLLPRIQGGGNLLVVVGAGKLPLVLLLAVLSQTLSGGHKVFSRRLTKGDVALARNKKGVEEVSLPLLTHRVDAGTATRPQHLLLTLLLDLLPLIAEQVIRGETLLRGGGGCRRLPVAPLAQPGSDVVRQHPL